MPDPSTGQGPHVARNDHHRAFSGLIEELRLRGLRISAAEAIDALRIIRHLALGAAGSLDRETVRNRVRPVLSKSAADSLLFDEAFDAWAAAPAPAEPQQPEEPPPRAKSWWEFLLRGKKPDRETRPKFDIWAALAFALILSTSLHYLFDIPIGGPGPPARPPVRSEPAPHNPVAPVISPTPSSGGFLVNELYPAVRYNRELRIEWVLLLLAVPLLASLPFLLAVRTAGEARLTRGQGGRLGGHLEPWPLARQRRMLVTALSARISDGLSRFVTGPADDVSRFARRPKLDLRRTLASLIRNPHRDDPRYRFARLRPHFRVLILVDPGAESPDHPLPLLNYCRSWARRLQESGASVDVFMLHAGAREAWVEKVGRLGRRLSPAALGSPSPGERLVLIAPLESLFAGPDLAIAPWLKLFGIERWRERAVFTPEAARYWDNDKVTLLERPLRDNSRTWVFPMEDHALEAWSVWLASEKMPSYQHSPLEDYPQELADHEQTYVIAETGRDAAGASPALPGTPLRYLLTQLRLYLNDNAFLWLCACAIPPKLDHTLALYLGQQYFLRCGVAAADVPHYMSANWPLLVRLPWLRDERLQMPDWLRLALLMKLPETVQQELRDVVTGVLGQRRLVLLDSDALRGMQGVNLDDPDELSRRATAREALYIGFVRDGMSAKALSVMMPVAWQAMFPELGKTSASRWARGARRVLTRMSFRQGVGSLGPTRHARALAITAAGCFVASLLGLAVAPPAATWPSAFRETLTTIKTYSLTLTHGDTVRSATFSPDGRRVVTASYDNTARLWDAESGVPLGQPMKHEGLVISAIFSPEGRRVVTASGDGTARLWDAESGVPVGLPMKHESALTGAVFSPDGHRVVTTSLDMSARLWDAESGEPLGQLINHKSWVRSAAFSPDGRRLVTASDDKTARLWDVESGAVLGQPMKHESIVNSAIFSPDGSRVVTASNDKTARLWDAESGAPLAQPMAHQGSVNSAVFSPDGRLLVTASGDGTARLWGAESGAPLGQPMKHGSAVNSAVFSPDGRRVVTASADDTARLWDAESGAPLGQPMAHEYAVKSSVFSPDGFRVVTASADKTARIWTSESGALLGQPMKHESSVDTAVFSPDGSRVVTASLDNTARLWDADSGAPLGQPMKHEGWVLSAAFNPDGRRVVTASDDKTARLWDGQSGAPLGQSMKHEGRVTHAVFSPDGRSVATASFDKTARLWDAESGAPLGKPMLHEDFVESVVFSPDGRRVVTASHDNTARLWDAASGTPLGSPMNHEGRVYSAVFSPDGRRVLTASFDETARLWDAASGEPLGQPMKHNGVVTSAVFSPDGRRVLTTVSDDITARLWNAESGTPLDQQIKNDTVINSAIFSPDGRLVATASFDKTVRLWDAASGGPQSVLLIADGSVTSTVWAADGQSVLVSTAIPFDDVFSGLTESGDSALPGKPSRAQAAFRVRLRPSALADERDSKVRDPDAWVLLAGLPFGVLLVKMSAARSVRRIWNGVAVASTRQL